MITLAISRLGEIISTVSGQQTRQEGFDLLDMIAREYRSLEFEIQSAQTGSIITYQNPDGT